MAQSGSRIRQLPDGLVNQIAAGEVIERPASVVKELIENALDAGASRVQVALEDGGVRLIRVTDDGSGIVRDDMPLAVSRHHTSKIAALEDLERVITLGFRGEALASIGSVSELRLTSAAADGGAWTVQYVQGVPRGGVEPAAHPPGTTVEVRNLFARVPARRKFLRSRRTELLHVQDLVKRIVLSRFDVGFRLSLGGRRALDLPPATQGIERMGRLAQVCGRRFVDAALALDVAVGDLAARGWLANPDFARSQADTQYLCLNGRVIRDRYLARAIRAAYGDRLLPDRYPGYVIYLEIDPRRVDVNVHPTKAEVRFRDPRMIHDFLYSAVRAALETSCPEATGRPAPAASAPTAWRGAAPDGEWRVYAAADTVAESSPDEASGPASAVTQRLFGPELLFVEGRYIVAATTDGRVAIIDAPAALERVLLIRLRVASEGGALASRPLLVPETVEAEAAVIAALDTAMAMLSRFGIEMRAAGPRQVRVLCLPVMFGIARLEDLVRSAVPAALSAQTNNTPGSTERLLATLARVGAGSGPNGPEPARRRQLMHGLEALAAQDARKLAGVCVLLGGDELSRVVGGR
jgi:DNA mismatch repair protein MutL